MLRVFFPTANRVEQAVAVAAAAAAAGVEATSAVPRAAAPTGEGASAVTGSAPAAAAVAVAAFRALPYNVAVKRAADTAPAHVQAPAVPANRCWRPTPRCSAQAVAHAEGKWGSHDRGCQPRRPTRRRGCCRLRGGPGEAALTLRMNGFREQKPDDTPALARVSLMPP